MAIGFWVLKLLASWIGADPTSRPTFWWIILSKMFTEIGELCVVPVCWSAVTKLAPKKYMAVLMGLMMAGIGFGGKLAGVIGSYVNQLGPEQIFSFVMVVMALMGLLAWIISPVLKKFCHGRH